MPLADTQRYSRLLLDYVANSDGLAPFYGHRPSLEGIYEQLQKKRPLLAVRQRLQATLRAQYSKLEPKKGVTDNLSALSEENTFVITTGHQLSICTGPLYVPFKIVSVISLCRKLQDRYPAYRFVPLFWMHTEDHDLAEIDHFYLQNTRYVADFPAGGAVGAFSASPVARILKEVPAALSLFRESYAAGTLALATRKLLHGLFGKEGLLALDPMERDLKKELLPLLRADIKGHLTAPFQTRTKALSTLGYKRQLSPRSLHFFYLESKHRGAIVRKGEGYAVLNSEVRFANDDALLEVAAAHPERFSPTAALRPLYQEAILPNLAYVGGPAEIAYWLQLGGIFDAMSLAMPVLVPRLFGALVPVSAQRRCQKLGLSHTDLFCAPSALHKKVFPVLASHTFTHEKEQLHQLFEGMADEIASLDPTLRAYVQRQNKAAEQSVSRVYERLRKSLLARSASRGRRLHSLADLMFPRGILQERTSNIMSFLAQQPSLLTQMVTELDPLDFRFHFMYLGNG